MGTLRADLGAWRGIKTSSPTHPQGPSPRRDWLPRGQSRRELFPEIWGRATGSDFTGEMSCHNGNSRWKGYPRRTLAPP